MEMECSYEKLNNYYCECGLCPPSARYNDLMSRLIVMTELLKEILDELRKRKGRE